MGQLKIDKQLQEFLPHKYSVYGVFSPSVAEHLIVNGSEVPFLKKNLGFFVGVPNLEFFSFFGKFKIIHEWFLFSLGLISG